jgi:hypothetical protein
MLTRIPDEWLLVGDPLSTVDRIQACRGSDGSYVFVYTSSGKPVRIRMRDKIHDKLTGKVGRAWWYDPRTGTSTPIGEFPKTESGDRPADVRRLDITREFTPPSSGPGNDWVLVVDDASKNYLRCGADSQSAAARLLGPRFSAPAGRGGSSIVSHHAL